MAKMKGGRGKLAIGANVIVEVRSWSISESPTETDTSILNNLDSSGDPVARTEAGANNVTLNLSIYVDNEDTAQSLLQVGGTEQNITLWPDGEVSGRPVYTMSACAVTTRSESADDINTYVGGEIALKANGGIDRDFVA